MTTIEAIHKAGSKSYKDYLVKRKSISDEATSSTWSNLTDNDKYIVIRYYATDNNVDTNTNNANKVGFLMGEGQSLSEAQDYLLSAFALHHEKEIPVCETRAKCKKLNEVVLSHLSEDDATDFTNTSATLFGFYINHARKGSNDNSKLDGLFDFIESTSSYALVGLEQQGYALLQGTWASFTTAIMDVLRNGNY